MIGVQLLKIILKKVQVLPIALLSPSPLLYGARRLTRFDEFCLNESWLLLLWKDLALWYVLLVQILDFADGIAAALGQLSPLLLGRWYVLLIRRSTSSFFTDVPGFSHSLSN